MKSPPSAGSAEDKVSMEVLRSFAAFDYLTRFVMPLCSALRLENHNNVPVTKTVLLVDLSGMGLSQIWNLKGYLRDFIQTLSTNFPEILDKVFVSLTLLNIPRRYHSR